MNTPNLKLIQGGAEASAEAKPVLEESTHRLVRDNIMQILGAELINGNLYWSEKIMRERLEQNNIEIKPDASPKEVALLFVQNILKPQTQVLGQGFMDKPAKLPKPEEFAGLPGGITLPAAEEKASDVAAAA